MPKVSVLMPVYKTKESYLRTAIESVLAQTYKDFELLLLDDCPECRSERVVEDYPDARIRYFQNAENMGIAGSRNKLISLAKGEYLAVMDHDDISLPRRLEVETAYLDAHPEVGVVSGQCKNLPGGQISRYPEENNDIVKHLLFSCCVVHSASMLRKSVLVQNNIAYQDLFSPAEDYALWSSLIGKTRFHNLRDVVLHYRNHRGNTSHQQKEKMNRARLRIIQNTRAVHSDLWNSLQSNLLEVYRIKLLGVPVLKLEGNCEIYRGKLFNVLPICSIKRKQQLMEY